MVVTVSLTSEDEILRDGYKLIPNEIDFTAYQYVFANPDEIINAYIVTTAESFLGMFLGITTISFAAYAISRPNFVLRGFMIKFMLIVMLFNAGLVPTYIVNTRYLGLGDSFWIYIFPGLANCFQLIIFKTFFQSLPNSLVESAKIDGASETTVFLKIIIPLSKPVFATLMLFQLLDKWNNWNTSLIYIRNEDLYTLQYLLQRIINDLEFVEQIAQEMPGLATDMYDTGNAPTESMRFAMCVVASGPMLLIFPFFQRYFSKGLTIGAVKG